MISALILCAHLAATKAVTHCKDGKSPGLALFQANGSIGMLMTNSPEQWHAIGMDSKEGSDEQKVYISRLAQKAGDDVFHDSITRIVIAFPGTAPASVGTWLTELSTYTEEAASQREEEELIRAEKANPGGVVDMEYLHLHGQWLQTAKQRRDQAAIDYRKLTGLAIPALP